MRTTVVLTSLAVVVACSPALARGGNAFGAGLLGGVVGGVVGGAVGGALAQPQPQPPAVVYAPPPVVYAAPPVVVERHVYAPAPVYVAPVQRVVAHPWPGPGFACYEPEPNAVNRTICTSEELSAEALALNQAVQAAIQQAAYNAGALHGEYASFMQSVRTSCAPYAVQAQGECISGMLGREREAMVARLSGIYAEEANRPIPLHVALQQRLHAVGLLAGTADGVYGDGTRRAISLWQARQGRPATGVISDEEVGLLMPETQNGTISVYTPPPKLAPAPIAPAAPPPPAPAIQQASVTNSVSVPSGNAPSGNAPSLSAGALASETTPAAVAASDPLGGLREGVPYALARPKLFAAGWQTELFKTDALPDSEREERQWFTDHHINEVEDCSSSGCKMQLHNADGRLLYIYTQSGSHTSDAYRGAGPAVIAYCLGFDDITCSSPPSSAAVLTGQQAAK